MGNIRKRFSTSSLDLEPDQAEKLVEFLNVLATYPVDADCLEIIKAADERVRVTALQYTEPREVWQRRSQGLVEDSDQPPLTPELVGAYREAEVILSHHVPTGLATMAPKLRWVQAVGAGIDHLLPLGGTGVWESEAIITGVGGFHSRVIAEFVMTFMLNHVKRTREFFAAQGEKEWTRMPAGFLNSKTVGIVGLGRIGTETAKLCKAFGMTVLANRRTVGGDKPDWVDSMLGPKDLEQVLSASDFVVLALPSVSDTTHVIGWRELTLMKPTSMLINVARGAVVDEGALVRALQEGVISAAGLDAFEEEPLPSSSPLWEMSNVFVTPHTAASSTEYGRETARYFAENIKRYLAGRPLMGVIDKRKGY